MGKDSSKLRIGVIGCGRIANRHLRVLAKFPDVEIVAAADVASDRVEYVSHRYNIPHRYTDYAALLGNPEVDAVAILIPVQYHAEVGRAALEAQKHVLLEKPLAFTLDEGDQLIDLASKSDRKAMIGFNRRFHPFALRAQELIRDEVLGKVEAINGVDTNSVRSVLSTPEWRARRQAGGGKLFEGTPHFIDLCRVMLQDEFEEVYVTERIEDGTDTMATVSARMSNGAMISALFSSDSGFRVELELFGRAGTLRADLGTFDGLTLQLTADARLDRRVKFRNRLLKTYRALRYLPWGLRRYGIFEAGYINEWRHFIDVVRYDRPVTCTFEDGYRALQVTLAAIESATVGKPVRVEDAPRSLAAVGS
jgi:predicted dehydrogenase